MWQACGSSRRTSRPSKTARRALPSRAGSASARDPNVNFVEDFYLDLLLLPQKWPVRGTNDRRTFALVGGFTRAARRPLFSRAGSASALRKVDVRLPGKGNSNSHGAMPVHLIITMIQWIRTSRLSIKNSLSPRLGRGRSYMGHSQKGHIAPRALT